ncbi:MAG: VOC family protein [Gammaproteobacteria bacterium]|nr:VOC family protein [Gammaproteobacteria bacterium]
MSVNYKPEAYHTVTPYVVVEDPAKLIAFLEATFNAVITECIRSKEGAVKHAELKIGDSIVMTGANHEDKPSAAMLYLYVEDTDATYQKALTAGAKSLMEPADQFYGDRNAGVEDMFGNRWWIATHVEDVAPEELEKRSQAFHESQGNSSL